MPEDSSHFAASGSRPPTFSVARTFPQFGRLTGVLIGISVVVAIVSVLGQKESVVGLLRITDQDYAEDSLPEVAHGQIWRLVTPIFLHYSILHILFNMMCLKTLGTAIEAIAGTGRLLALTLVIGVISNLGQFYFAGPAFGGMSGVVYGLFGYVWMKTRFDKRSGYFISQQSVLMMVGWLVACMLNFIPGVANYAHGFGIVAGMVWGVVEAKVRIPRD